jgi:hypothetical protein
MTRGGPLATLPFRTTTSRSISESGIFDLTALTTRCASHREEAPPSGNFTTMMSLPDGRGTSVTQTCFTMTSPSVGRNPEDFWKMQDRRTTDIEAPFQRRRSLTKATYTELTTQRVHILLRRYGPNSIGLNTGRCPPAICLHQAYNQCNFLHLPR